MAVVVILIGVVLILAAIRGQEATLGTLLRSDFTGQDSFLVWVAAVLIIGMAGYVDALRLPSRMLLALLLIVFLLANHGVFAKLQQAVANPAAPLPALAGPDLGGGSAAASAPKSSGSGGILGGIGSVFGGLFGGG